MNPAGQVWAQRLHRKSHPQFLFVGVGKPLAQSDPGHAPTRNPRRPDRSSDLDGRHAVPPFGSPGVRFATCVVADGSLSIGDGAFGHDTIVARRAQGAASWS